MWQLMIYVLLLTADSPFTVVASLHYMVDLLLITAWLGRID